MVYGVRGMGCVKDDGLRCHVTRCQMIRTRWNNSKACYREECEESGLGIVTSLQTLRAKNSYEDMAM